MTSHEDSSDRDGHADSPAPSRANRRPSPIRILLARGIIASLLALAIVSVFDRFGWVGELASVLGWRLAALGVIIAGLEHRRPTHAIPAILSALLALVPMLLLSPRAPASDGTPGVTVRLLVANLRTTNAAPDALLEILAASDADVLILTEPPQAVRRALRPDGTLARQFTDIARTRPLRGEHAPIIIASRLPLVDTLDAQHGRDAVILRKGDTEFAIIATQLLSPRSPARNRTAREQATELAQITPPLSARSLPLIIAGDLNATPTSHRSRWLAAATDTRRAKPRWSAQGSWPAGLPTVLALPIDGALLSKDISVARWELVRLPGSDHHAVLIQLVIPSR